MKTFSTLASLLVTASATQIEASVEEVFDQDYDDAFEDGYNAACMDGTTGDCIPPDDEKDKARTIEAGDCNALVALADDKYFSENYGSGNEVSFKDYLLNNLGIAEIDHDYFYGKFLGRLDNCRDDYRDALCHEFQGFLS